MRIAKIVGMLAAAVTAGVGFGVWTAQLTYVSSCRGLCIMFQEYRFAGWQSALLGAAAGAGILAGELALDADLRDVGRRFTRWLNHDLLPIDRSE